MQYESQNSDRYFLSIEDHEWSSQPLRYFVRMFLIPLGLYLLWASLYSLKVFVCSAKKIQERNYETMYVYYI